VKAAASACPSSGLTSASEQRVSVLRQGRQRCGQERLQERPQVEGGHVLRHHGRAGLLAQRAEQAQQQVVLIAEVVVEGSLGQTGLPGHRAHGGAVVALL
jgi:hypothetical protein